MLTAAERASLRAPRARTLKAAAPSAALGRFRSATAAALGGARSTAARDVIKDRRAEGTIYVDGAVQGLWALFAASAAE
jgi:hypothetical protein